jgi:hypothetical protein
MGCKSVCVELVWTFDSSNKFIIYFILAELEAATSTTHSEAPPKTPADPSEWSIEDVIQHIAFIDPALGVHADLFRKHVSSTDNHVIYLKPFWISFMH